MNLNTELFNRVSAFLNIEADMLDHKEYQSWLKLWSKTGLYIVPVDVTVPDYKNALNIAYDDEPMRKLRVERLEGGEAVSTLANNPTVRTISAIRILSSKDDLIKVRCSYCLYENKAGDLRPYPANVEFVLKQHDDGFLIEQKIVKLIRSSQYLATVSYIF